ncbi:MAG: hypothetical protein ABIN01_21940 [Ferruginibacter sp.]
MKRNITNPEVAVITVFAIIDIYFNLSLAGANRRYIPRADYKKACGFYKMKAGNKK